MAREIYLGYNKDFYREQYFANNMALFQGARKLDSSEIFCSDLFDITNQNFELGLLIVYHIKPEEVTLVYKVEPDSQGRLISVKIDGTNSSMNELEKRINNEMARFSGYRIQQP